MTWRQAVLWPRFSVRARDVEAGIYKVAKMSMIRKCCFKHVML